MLKVEAIKTIQEFQNLREDWNYLLSASKADNIFLTWEWLFTWWEVYGVNKELCILLIKEEDKLIGIAPLMITKENVVGIPVRLLKFIGSEKVCSEYLDLITISGRESELLSLFIQYINQNNNLWDVLLINDITEDSPTVKFFSDKANFYKNNILKRRSTINPYIHLPKTIEEFYQKLGSKRRSDVKVKSNKLAAEHQVSYHEIIDKESLGKCFEIFVNLHQTLWNERGFPGVFKRESFLNFHRAIAERFFEHGWLKLFFLNIDNNPAAALYGFQYRDKFYYYQSGFNPKWKIYGIGKLLLTKTITEAINTNLQEYDFLRGGAQYKSQFAINFRHNLEIVIIRKNFKSRLYISTKKFKKLFKNVLKNILPQDIVGWVRKIRDYITLR